MVTDINIADMKRLGVGVDSARIPSSLNAKKTVPDPHMPIYLPEGRLRFNKNQQTPSINQRMRKIQKGYDSEDLNQLIGLMTAGKCSILSAKTALRCSPLQVSLKVLTPFYSQGTKEIFYAKVLYSHR